MKRFGKYEKIILDTQLILDIRTLHGKRGDIAGIALGLAAQRLQYLAEGPNSKAMLTAKAIIDARIKQLVGARKDILMVQKDFLIKSADPVIAIDAMIAELRRWKKAVGASQDQLFIWHFAQYVAVLGAKLTMTKFEFLTVSVLARAGVEKSQAAVHKSVNRVVKPDLRDAIKQGRQINTVIARL